MFKLPAYFNGFSSRSDGSAGLRFVTQELTPDDFAVFKQAHNAFGWLLFSENDMSAQDVPEENAPEDGVSPSERLRRVQYVFFKEKKIAGDFETWRRQQMELIINRYKEQL